MSTKNNSNISRKWRQWDDLSMKERAHYLKLGLDNGITDLSTIHDVYNEYSKRNAANNHTTLSTSTEPPRYLKRPNDNFDYTEFFTPSIEADTTIYKILDRDPKKYLRSKAAQIASTMSEQIKDIAIKNLRLMGKQDVKTI